VKAIFLISIFISSLLCSQALTAQEHADSFIVEIFSNYVKVISPKKKKKFMSLVILNKTLSNIYGKIATNKKDIKFFSVAMNKHKSIQIKSSNELIKFVPLSPTFQEVELLYGVKSYEVPEQK
jgi:hypothetical protein